MRTEKNKQAGENTSDSIPRNSLAHKIVRLNGWTRSDAIIDIASYDKVSEQEAGRRFDIARQQMNNRCVAQRKRRYNDKVATEDARSLALSIAFHQGAFVCSRDLKAVSLKAGWGGAIGSKSTGRVMKEIIIPLEKESYFVELRGEDDEFIGYVLSDKGKSMFESELSYLKSWNPEN